MNQCSLIFKRIPKMISKETIVIILLSGTLQILASDNHDKTLEIIKSHDYKEIKHIQNSKKENEEKFQNPTLQFQKDNHLGGKNYINRKSINLSEHNAYMKYNEIDSNEYVDKYNKYGNTFNPDLIKVQKYKTYQKKRALEKEKHVKENEDVYNLMNDTYVNYSNKDNEMVEKLGSLLHDTNVNYINNKKKISGDSELITEKKQKKTKEDFQGNYQNGNEMFLKRYKKEFNHNFSKIDLSNPPPANETVLMARYIVHTVDWAALATLSARASTKGSPFVCVKATSDGEKNKSTGVPFFYMSPRDLCTQDLQKDNRVSVLVTLSETEYCKNQNLDPQDPRCAKLTLSGKVKRIKAGSDEEKFAKNALFSRHPAMKSWPADHDWYFTKLKIGQIILLDQFGGATYIKVKDYLNGKVAESDRIQK